MTQNPAAQDGGTRCPDTSKKPITTKNMTPTNEACSVLVIVAIIALTAAILMEAWQRKQDREEWEKYENTRKKHD